MVYTGLYYGLYYGYIATITGAWEIPIFAGLRGFFGPHLGCRGVHFAGRRRPPGYCSCGEIGEKSWKMGKSKPKIVFRFLGDFPLRTGTSILQW